MEGHRNSGNAEYKDDAAQRNYMRAWTAGIDPTPSNASLECVLAETDDSEFFAGGKDFGSKNSLHGCSHSDGRAESSRECALQFDARRQDLLSRPQPQRFGQRLCVCMYRTNDG